MHLHGIKQISACLLGCLLASPVLANPSAQILSCAADSNADSRLACYDALAETLAKTRADAHTDTQAVNGQWTVTELDAPGDRSRQVRLTLSAAVATELNQSAGDATLILTCKAAKSRVSMDWGLYLGLGSIRMKTYFDGQSNRSRIWTIAEDNQTIELSGSDISFIKQMIKHNSLITEVTPFGERPITAEFDIRGLANAIVPLREACNW